MDPHPEAVLQRCRAAQNMQQTAPIDSDGTERKGHFDRRGQAPSGTRSSWPSSRTRPLARPQI
eukprot:10127502-Prorocentrum_lima.AAC.1